MEQVPERHTWTLSPSPHRTRAASKNMLNRRFCSGEDQKPSSSVVPFLLISCNFFKLALKYSDVDPTIPTGDSVFPHESPADQEAVWDRVFWRCNSSGRAGSILNEILTSQSGQRKAARLDGEVQGLALDGIKGCWIKNTRTSHMYRKTLKKMGESSF